MSTLTMGRSSLWPKVALDCAVVTRGELIRRARDLRRISRADLAKLTGVGARTITRIENGNVSDKARSVAALEHELAAELAQLSGGETPARSSVTLDEATDLDLLTTLGQRLAEQSRRIADLEAQLSADPNADDDRPRVGPPGGVPMHFLAADAPSARGHNGGSDTAQGNQ